MCRAPSKALDARNWWLVGFFFPSPNFLPVVDVYFFFRVWKLSSSLSLSLSLTHTNSRARVFARRFICLFSSARLLISKALLNLYGGNGGVAVAATLV